MATESGSEKPMENIREPVGSASSSSPSLTNELFGSNESAPPKPSFGTFSSIFPPPPTVMGRSGSASELVGLSIERHSVASHFWNKGISEDLSKSKDGTSHCPTNKDRSSIFVERSEPCPLSSSLYYGGLEDMYMRSSNAQSPGSYPEYKKDGVEDDQNGNNSHSASRGNWWQGSLYY